MPVLSARHLERIKGGLLYAAFSNVPWATLLARTFDVDVECCAPTKPGSSQPIAVTVAPLFSRVHGRRDPPLW
jgi:hypothetical protein